MIQAGDGYVRNHIANTFHLVHYYRLLNENIPHAEAILKRVLRDQKGDGSWLLNPPSWDVHAGFDAVFVLRQLGNHQAECRQAIQKAAGWALGCRNQDGGFGHFPGYTSDMDAVYFHVWLAPDFDVRSATLSPLGQKYRRSTVASAHRLQCCGGTCALCSGGWIEFESPNGQISHHRRRPKLKENCVPVAVWVGTKRKGRGQIIYGGELS